MAQNYKLVKKKNLGKDAEAIPQKMFAISIRTYGQPASTWTRCCPPSRRPSNARLTTRRGATDNLIQELRSEKYKSERSEQVQNQTTAVTRPLCDKAYAEVVKLLNALCLIYGDETYADLIPYWNTRIDHYRTVISHRLGAGKGGSTGSGDNLPNPPFDTGAGDDDERPGEL